MKKLVSPALEKLVKDGDILDYLYFSIEDESESCNATDETVKIIFPGGIALFIDSNTTSMFGSSSLGIRLDHLSIEDDSE